MDKTTVERALSLQADLLSRGYASSFVHDEVLTQLPRIDHTPLAVLVEEIQARHAENVLAESRERAATEAEQRRRHNETAFR